MKKWLIGIDEAGRGPVSGPVSVGVVLVPFDFDWNIIPGVGDSKQVSEKKREIVFLRAIELQKKGMLKFSVKMVSAKVIDKKGIVFAINYAMKQALDCVMTKSVQFGDVAVKLDGSLKAPAEYLNQETIIKGDAKEKVIGLASIMAKVTRDQYMIKIAHKPEYKVYDFARHKGYGTKIHRVAIAKNGLSTEHRASYCKNINVVV